MIIDPPFVFFLNGPTIFDFGFPVPFPSLPENQSPLRVFSSATEFISIPSNSFHPSVSYLLIHVYYPFPQFSPRFSPLLYIFPYPSPCSPSTLPPLPSKGSSLPIVLIPCLSFSHASLVSVASYTLNIAPDFSFFLDRGTLCLVFSIDPSLEQRDANARTCSSTRFNVRGRKEK